MLHHVIELRFHEGTTDEQIQRMAHGLLGLRDRIATIRSMKMGRDLRIRPDNFEFASLIEFDDEAGYLEFRDHPAHRQWVRDQVQPIMAQRAGVVFLSS
ncbi:MULTISPECIES: Dabb family protein [unclassified Rhodococcus (in: high G+C Gram-positive bacteria)]|uniref:Dabb family protein n=1 Tax=unclassified Rhodococcus (in: high G+C Gram-positive bacteria) TaxID=192944 RepID=UPI0018CEC0AE|nr:MULTISPECIES: Dabb family protein [unclassified Rhodococcus (in: high G+C Gram-positive bacteria)]MBH0118244.1 Dabb family protein [Rhodococcus sp. CX]MCK8675393.1 Dabb family protein [Rhodococcus sp. HM1]